MSRQPSYTSRDRTFDYLQLHWLEKTTGRPKHDWDLYIIKELLDNALDADERWAIEHDEGTVDITIDLYYRHNQAFDIHSLEIAVSNQASFPTQHLAAIFDLTAYTSNKSHYNYPSRGQQGNALKTILGIPYALRHFGYGDYANIRKPLVIKTGAEKVVVSFEIDEANQKVCLSPLQPERLRSPHQGTRIEVGIDRFVQEQPRTVAELHRWAQLFALFNPHAVFHWHVGIGQEKKEWHFWPSSWDNLFRDTPPIHWYEYTQLRELLLSLQRESGPDTPLPQVLQAFAGFTPEEDPHGQIALKLCDELGFQTLADLALTTDHVRTLREGLRPKLLSQGRQISASSLGGLGEESLSERLNDFFSLETPPLYRRIADNSEPTHAFVLELLLASLPKKSKRLIWTALNHTPTYEDPFFTRLLYPPILQNQPVHGLDGFLDAYGRSADEPVLLVMHLICPNLAYQDFAKTRIEIQPFRESLATLLDEMLTEFKAELELEDLEPLVHRLMPQVIHFLSPNGLQKFTSPQLLRAVRLFLSQELHTQGQTERTERWLTDPAASARLQSYIQTYTQQHPQTIINLVQPERGRLSLPVHPEGHTTLRLSQITPDMLNDACINKILLVTEAELEVLIIANRLLARFDMGLLYIEDAFETLLPHLKQVDLPLALLHHATPNGCLLAESIRNKIKQAKLTHIRLHDLGLTPAQGLALALPAEPSPSNGNPTALARYLDADEVSFLVDQRQQISLFSLTIERLTIWLEERFVTVGLAPKLMPHEEQLRTTALTTMKKTLTDWALHRFYSVTHADFLADQVIQFLSNDLHIEQMPPQLQENLHRQPQQAWRALWNELTTKRCETIIEHRQEQLNQLILAYKEQLADKGA